MPSPLPYLIVVWTVGLYLVHVAVLYLVYLGMRDEAHQGLAQRSDLVESATGRRAEGTE